MKSFVIAFKSAECADFARNLVKNKLLQVLGVRPNNVEVSCGSGARRLSETSESDTYEYQVVVNGNEMELEEIKDAAKVYFTQSSKAEFDLGMALTAVTVDGELVNVDVNVCRAWQPEQCGINPSNIRAFCDASYNPTVGVDSVSGGVKVTATFPVAPGLATKNSADILKYTYDANKLWSVGTRDYALPDIVSVYHPLTTCSLETESSTSSIASSADKAASESQSRGGGYEKVVEQTTKAEKGGVGTERKQTKTTQVGFGRSKETKSYEKAASQGLDEEYTFRARAVAMHATIDTSHLTSCDMSEYFVTAVLDLAMKIASDDQMDYTSDLDAFLYDFGTHLPTKFELGCEATRAYRFSSSMDQSAKSDSLNKASNSGFDVMGFNYKQEKSSFTSTSNEMVVSAGEAFGSTQITCGSPKGAGSDTASLDDFCDSVAMNNAQSHIPHLLTVDEMVTVWSIMAKVEPWIGTGTQDAPEISKADIEEAARLAEDRFTTLITPVGDEAECFTAGHLDPPNEPGVCAFNGTGWDCSQCSCYNLNAGKPDAEPRSSCARSACKPEQLTTKRPGTAATGAAAGLDSGIIDDVKIFGDSGCASTVGWQSVEGAGALNGDLNQDAKHAKSKDKMYLCYHTTKNVEDTGDADENVEGIVDLKVVEGKKTYCDREISDKYKNVIGGRATDKATDWNADLNNGVGGDYLYLCQAKSTEGAKLVSLKFYESKSCPKDYTIVEGWGGANGNFNQGAKGGGKSIYLCAKYDTIGEAMDNTETGPLLIAFKYLTKAECNSKCLQWPVETGDQCHGFWFNAYDNKTFSGGECKLYSTTFSKETIDQHFQDPPGSGAYFQYTHNKDGCHADYPGWWKSPSTCCAASDYTFHSIPKCDDAIACGAELTCTCCVPRDSGANCTEIDRAESGETLLGDDGEFYPICSICPANAEVVNAVTLLAYPDVTCPFGYRDVRDANECERLAIQNGYEWVGQLYNDANWIDGCFEWYDTTTPATPGTWQRVYFNNRPGAATGEYGGNKPCISESIGAVTVTTAAGAPYAILLSYSPDVTCPAEYRDVQDARECKLLAEQNGGVWKGELNDDTNWIHGCFNWYPSPGNPKGSSRNVYYNNRPGATSGVYGGHKPCISQAWSGTELLLLLILETYSPGVTCPVNYRDILDANECERLAIQNGHTFVGVLSDDANWIHGCFEWYDTKYADGGKPKGSFKKVYWNERPGATSGVYGGHKPCVYNPVTCNCDTPNTGTIGKNGYTCTDGSFAYCEETQMCTAVESFEKYKWGGCTEATPCECFPCGSEAVGTGLVRCGTATPNCNQNVSGSGCYSTSCVESFACDCDSQVCVI